VRREKSRRRRIRRAEWMIGRLEKCRRTKKLIKSSTKVSGEKNTGVVEEVTLSDVVVLMAFIAFY
jgi:hypothetical protein